MIFIIYLLNKIMSLFIGNLSKNVTFNDIKDEFNEIGSCKI